MQEPDPTYRVKWNNVSSELNLLTAFCDLRAKSVFFDVSLSCADSNTEGKILRAHKVILSAYSSIFREMLFRHPNQSDPLIFLKGVTHENARKLIDFMYNGEVHVAESELSSFMEVAEELQIRGLKSNKNKNTTEDSVSRFPKLPISRYEPKKSLFSGLLDRNIIEAKLKREVQTDITRQPIKKIKQDLCSDPIKQDTDITDKTNLEEEDDLSKNDTTDSDIDEDTKLFISNLERTLPPNNYLKIKDEFKEESAEKQGRVEDLMERIGSVSATPGGKKRAHARCKACGKETRTDDLRKHILRYHAEKLVDNIMTV